MKVEKSIYNFEKLAFFPGCSLVTSAEENYESLKIVCKSMGYDLEELEGWNCCGTSSAHSINMDLAIELALRNISLAYSKKELLIACPSCFLRLKYAHTLTKNNPKKREYFEKKFKVSFPDDLVLVPFLKFLNDNIDKFKPKRSLNGLVVAPYYGCMRNLPLILRKDTEIPSLIEGVIKSLGGKSIIWSGLSKCCGSFLAAVKPKEITEIINKIVAEAVGLKADCIVTACSMCHLTLEMRCTLKENLPIFHFSELLALSLEEGKHIDWFKRHIIDPIPLLKQKELI